MAFPSRARRSSCVDQLLDMGRTAVNVMGNCISTAVVARWEGVFDDARMREFAAQNGRAPARAVPAEEPEA